MPSYKSVFYQKRKTSMFAYNFTLSESICLTDHEKQMRKFVAHWKLCQKSSQRELTREECISSAKTWLINFDFFVSFVWIPTERRFKLCQVRKLISCSSLSLSLILFLDSIRWEHGWRSMETPFITRRRGETKQRLFTSQRRTTKTSPSTTQPKERPSTQQHCHGPLEKPPCSFRFRSSLQRAQLLWWRQADRAILRSTERAARRAWPSPSLLSLWHTTPPMSPPTPMFSFWRTCSDCVGAYACDVFLILLWLPVFKICLFQKRFFCMTLLLFRFLESKPTYNHCFILRLALPPPPGPSLTLPFLFFYLSISFDLLLLLLLLLFILITTFIRRNQLKTNKKHANLKNLTLTLHPRSGAQLG